MRSAINKWLRYFFGISQTEANGVILLLFIMTMVTILPLILHIANFRDENPRDDQQQKLDSLVALLNNNQLQINEGSPVSPGSSSINYFAFDPNTASISDFIALGLSAEIGNRIIKYRENGGVFHKQEDFKKIYGLSDEEYESLFPHISIIKSEDEVLESIQIFRSDEEMLENEFVLFDINEVDSSELLIVKGIGEVLASRIIKFRNSLGGFVRIEQLMEVYGLEEYAFENLTTQSFIEDTFTPRKVLINELSADSIARHPYIDFNKARVIIAYRDQHGKFLNIEALNQILVLDEAWLNRISPYLEF